MLNENGGVAIGFVILCLLALGLLMWYRYRQLRQARLEVAACPELAHVNRRTLTLRYVGVVLGVLFMLVVFSSGGIGIVAPAAPFWIACCIIVCLIVGDLIDRDANPKPGVASMERRTVGRYASDRLVIWIIVAIVALLVLTIVAMNVPSRSTMYVTSPDGETAYGCGIPWYSLSGAFIGPLILSLLLTVALVAVALQIIVRRPRDSSNSTIAAWDDALRRRSVGTVLWTLLWATVGSAAVISIQLIEAQQEAYQHVNGLDLTNYCGEDFSGWEVTFSSGLRAFGNPITLALLIVCAGIAIVPAIAAAARVLADFAPDVPEKSTPMTAGVSAGSQAIQEEPTGTPSSATDAAAGDDCDAAPASDDVAEVAK